MLLKKANDPSPRILRGWFVIPNLNHSKRFEQQCVVLVKKRMARFRILFHVVRDTCRNECLLQFLRDTMVPVLLGSIAPDNRACSRKKGPGIPRQRPAIADARRSESMIRREQQGKPASHAKPDHSNLACASILPD